MLDPLAEDQLGLLVLDLGPLDLATRVGERERRQVLAGEEGRDIGRREVEPVGGDVHPGRVAEAAAVAYSQPSVGRLRAAPHVLDDRGGDRLDPSARNGDDGRRAPGLRVEVRDLVAELGRAGDQDEVGSSRGRAEPRSRFDGPCRRSAGARAVPSRAPSSPRTSGEPPTRTRRRRPPASHASTSSARARSFREPPQRVHADVRDGDDLAAARIGSGRAGRAEAREASVDRRPRPLELRLGEPALARVRDPLSLEHGAPALGHGAGEPERGEKVADRADRSSRRR